MTDRPILFSGPMVRALLDGRKTQTRRVLRPVRGVMLKDFEFGKNEPNEVGNWGRLSRDKIRNPDFSIGDRLWVRETVTLKYMENFLSGEPTQNVIAGFAADNTDVVEQLGFQVSPWWKNLDRDLSSIHMPRWASRLTLAVTDVRVQRLQEIGLCDTWAEGCEVRQMWLFGADKDERDKIGRGVYQNLWESLHGRGSWAANPWIVALTFDVQQRNIDAKDKTEARSG